jgi:hypothetical protein
MAVHKPSETTTERLISAVDRIPHLSGYVTVTEEARGKHMSIAPQIIVLLHHQV